MDRLSCCVVVMALMVGVPGCGGNSPAPQQEQVKSDSRVPVSSLPFALLRRAHQHLEAMRGSEMAPTWIDVTFAELAAPLYRPDVDGVAYYEIPVIPAGASGPPCGHVILSTGPHDMPVPHWNFEGQSICEQLDKLAVSSGKQAARYYKLDALSYVAEDAGGEQIASVGTPLASVSGMDPAWLDQGLGTRVTAWTPDVDTADDSDDMGAVDGALETEGAEPPKELLLGGWASWQALKAGYQAAYGVLAEDLRALAKQDWNVEQLAEDNGEGLRVGDDYRLSFIREEPLPFRIEGPGADPEYLKVSVERSPGRPAVLVLDVVSALPQEELLFDVEIDHETFTETRRFAIVGTLGIIDQQKTGRFTPRHHLDWGPWTFHWAGGHADQRLYYQMESGELPNVASCYSGCGATAWAMLFGWADNQAASGNAYWEPRWGLYRSNGGFGDNAVAPRTQNGGVRNMTWEIRAHIGTWCAFSSGPTFPWDMGNASLYFAGRTGTRLESHCDTAGLHSDNLRDLAMRSIRDRDTPAVIGTGWLNHYPLAYGYAFRTRTTRSCFLWECWENTETSRWFYVNQGWGGPGNGWVGAGTFLYGSIAP